MTDIVGLVAQTFVPQRELQVRAADQADAILRGGVEGRAARRNALGMEKATLLELSHTGLTQLIVDYSAQQLVVENISAGVDNEVAMFEPFEANGFPSFQGAMWRSMLTYGTAYGLTLPGTRGAYIRAFDPRFFGAQYVDLVDDETPEYAWRYIPKPNGEAEWRVYDTVFEHVVEYKSGAFKVVDSRRHGMGVVPVVRFANAPDLAGKPTGEPERFKRETSRHDKTVNDRLLIQHYNSWRIRTAIHMDDTLSEEERAAIKLKLAHDDILIGTGDAEFGTLDQTDLSPMAAAQQSDRDTVAAVSQTPVWAFNGGSMVNLSADALLEAKSGNRQKVWGIQRSASRPLCTWARHAALAEGRLDDAGRFDVKASWADIGSVSLAAAADALGKVTAQLGVPPELLWDRLPGIPANTVQEWREYAQDNPQGDLALAAVLARHDVPVADVG